MRPRRFDENGLKECKVCGKLKTKEEYYPHKDYHSGFRPECKECGKEDQRRYNKTNPKDPEKNRKDKLERHYGMTLEDYDRMFVEQGGVCKICEKPQTVQNRKDGRIVSNLFIDHCHETGDIRGLLCHNCNFGLGYFKDSKLNLINALKYLEDFEIG